MFPWPIDEIDRKDLQSSQPPLYAIYHYLQTLTVTDYKAWVVQFICHLFEVKIGILGWRHKKAT